MTTELSAWRAKKNEEAMIQQEHKQMNGIWNIGFTANHLAAWASGACQVARIFPSSSSAGYANLAIAAGTLISEYMRDHQSDELVSKTTRAWTFLQTGSYALLGLAAITGDLDTKELGIGTLATTGFVFVTTLTTLTIAYCSSRNSQED